MRAARKNRRRTLIVNTRLQRRIIMSVAFLPTVALIFAAVGVAVFCRDVIEEAAAVQDALPSLGSLLTWVYALMIVFGILVIRQVTILSHRIAGPSHRLTAAMKRIREGDIGFRIHVRPLDFNTEIVDEFNQLLDWLNEHPPADVTTTDTSPAEDRVEQETGAERQDQPSSN